MSETPIIFHFGDIEVAGILNDTETARLRRQTALPHPRVGYRHRLLRPDALRAAL